MVPTTVRRRFVVLAALAGLLILASPSTVHAAPAPAPVEASAVTVTYRAMTGDTLWGLAGRICGNPYLYPRIAAASGISNPDLIQVGQHLTIPCARAGHASVGTAPVTATRTASWVHPLPGHRCTSGWGASRDGGARRHKGADLPARSGTPVRAVHAGRVAFIGYQAGGAGHYVMINHGSYQSVSMHLRSRTFLRRGATVRAGQTIGYVGDTGNPAPGAYHLHFEIHHGAWNRINPVRFMAGVGVRIVGC